MSEARDITPDDLSPLALAWKQHFAAIKVIRDELQKEGGSIQVDIVVRDKTETEKYTKRKAAAKKRRKTW